MERGTASVKTTRNVRSTANPRRTTLAHLPDAAELTAEPAAAPQQPAALPAQTANPRRTKLMELPKQRPAAD